MPSWTPPGETDRGLRASAPVDHWHTAMRHICVRHALPTAGLAPMATGSDVVWGGEGFVVKLTRPKWATEIETERTLCAHLHGRLPVRVPAVLGHGRLADWPYVVLERLYGFEPVGDVFPTLPPAERRTLAGRIGEMVAALHAAPPVSLPSDPWPDFAARLVRTATERMARAGADPAWLPDVARRVEATPVETTRPVLLHTELLDQHVLVERGSDGVRPAALIDFADGRLGHADYEWPALAEFVFKGEPGCMRACLEGYGAAPASLTAARSASLIAWSLIHQFGSVRRAAAAVDAPAGDWATLTRRLYGMAEGPGAADGEGRFAPAR